MDQGKKTNPRAKYRTPDLRPQHGQQLRRGFWFRVVSTTTTNMAMRFGKKKKKNLTSLEPQKIPRPIAVSHIREERVRRGERERLARRRIEGRHR